MPLGVTAKFFKVISKLRSNAFQCCPNSIWKKDVKNKPPSVSSADTQISADIL